VVVASTQGRLYVLSASVLAGFVTTTPAFSDLAIRDRQPSRPGFSQARRLPTSTTMTLGHHRGDGSPPLRLACYGAPQPGFLIRRRPTVTDPLNGQVT
jgi:hypothetical protein